MTIRNIVELAPDAPIPNADYFKFYQCGDPGHMHIVLFDIADEPFAQLTIDVGNFESICAAAKEFFAGEPQAEPTTVQ